MTTLHMGSQLWVVLNSQRAISDIQVKRSKATGERPDMPIASGLVSKGKRAVLRKSTSAWNEGRRLMHHLLSGTALRKYAELEEQESCQMLLYYLHQPEKWYSHHFRFSTAIMHRIVMGERLNKTQDELNEYQRITNEFLFSLFRSPIDFFPKLANASFIPRALQFWRGFWEEMGDSHTKVFEAWWKPVQKAVIDGTAHASFVRDVLLGPTTGYKGTDEDAMYLATSVMAAGGDNTRMTLNVFIMAAICYPEIVQRARSELDSICGGGNMRLPVVADMESIPYMAALVKETLRWRPTVPLVPPHELTEEQLEYDGYIFPKGTNFLINTVAISQECTDPEHFMPERWMDESRNELNILHDFWGFGAGRRICVGYKIAQQILFLAISQLIFCFDFVPVCVFFSPDSLFLADNNQNGPYDSRKLNPWSVTEPFPVKVTLRSASHGELIRKTASSYGLE